MFIASCRTYSEPKCQHASIHVDRLTYGVREGAGRETANGVRDFFRLAPSSHWGEPGLRHWIVPIARLAAHFGGDQSWPHFEDSDTMGREANLLAGSRALSPET